MGSESEQLSKADRKRMFSTTMAVIQQDPSDVRARLQLVDLLQQDGRTEDAVEELLRTAAVYSERGVPIKAVAVLRQAVKMAPERPDVRVTYGQVFEKLRMNDDAAREYRRACDLYNVNGQHRAEVEALAQLVSLDDGRVEDWIMVAEALNRVGRVEKAAGMYRRLGERLLAAGETNDWEIVAERAAFLDADDVTTAHDLALHYVRSGRYPMALGKLIRCLEAEPNDVELLELITETLEHLGQRQRAAVLTRQLITRYRQGGLTQEADAALRRLYALDPDDEEARAAMGVLHGAIQDETVIELQADDSLPSMEAIDEDDDEVGFGGDFIDRLLTSPGQKSSPILRPDSASDAPPILDDDLPPLPNAGSDAPPLPLALQSAPPIPASTGDVDAPPLPDDAAFRTIEDKMPPLPDEALPGGAPPLPQPSATPAAPSASAPRAPSSRRVARPALRASSTGRQASAGFGVVPSSPAARGKITQRARPGARAGKRPESAGFGPNQPDEDATSMLPVVDEPALKATRNARPRPPRKTDTSPNRPVTASRPRPQPARPTTGKKPAAAPTRGSRQAVRAAPRAGQRPSARPATRPPRPRTRQPTLPPAIPEATPAAGADPFMDSSVPPPLQPRPVVAPRAPTSTENANLFLLEEDEETGFGSQPMEHTSIDPGVFDALNKLGDEPTSEATVALPEATGGGIPEPSRPGTRTLTPKRRSTQLPRPRLTRARRSHNDGQRQRGIETDLKTLDFFIERGFYESAAALVGELEKRYPHSDELRLRRRRIAQMARK